MCQKYEVIHRILTYIHCILFC